MPRIIIHTLTDLPSSAKQLIQAFGNKKIIAFSGEMGAGKTTLIKAWMSCFAADGKSVKVFMVI